MAYGDFKDLKRRTFPYKVLRHKAFNIAKNPKYDGYQRGLASMVYKFFDKTSKGSDVANNEIKQKFTIRNNCTKQLLETLKKEQDLKAIFRVLI